MQIQHNGETYTATTEYNVHKGREETRVIRDGVNYSMTDFKYETSIGKFGKLDIEDLRSISTKARLEYFS